MKILKSKNRLTLGLSVLAAVATLTSRAQSLEDFGAVSPLVKPGGDLGAANQKLDFHTDLFTGRFQYSLPIAIPPGRQGSEPAVALTYNSSGGNGWCGVGWDLSMGSILRETKKGVPVSGSAYSDTFGFSFSFAGYSGKLISLGNGDYVPEINSSFLNFKLINPATQAYWQVTDKSGTKYYFGETSAEREANSLGTFSWQISRIVDANGNKTMISYQRPITGEQLYLAQIAYNGNDLASPALPPSCTIDFALEPAARDDVASSLISGVEMLTSRRLQSVSVKAGDQLVRQYVLSYVPSPLTARSLLEKIRQYGSDGSSQLPECTFAYPKPSSVGFSQPVTWTIDNQGNSYLGNIGNQDVQLSDMNGDGLADRVMVQKSPPYTCLRVQLNNGTGYSSSLMDWAPYQGDTSAAWYHLGVNAQSELSDINGDSLPDLVFRAHYLDSPHYTFFEVQLNNGGGFNSIGNWNTITSPQPILYQEDDMRSPSTTKGSGRDSIALLIDMNGDGLPDRVMSSLDSHFSVQRNTGAGFSSSLNSWAGVESATGNNLTTSSYFAPRARNNTTVQAELMDLNGDSLPDRMIQGYVQLNNGWNGFLTKQSWNLSTSDNPGELDSIDGAYSRLLIDINGDGSPDLLTADGDHFTVRVNTGRKFSTTPNTWSGVVSDGHGGAGWDALRAWDVNGTRVELCDMNGDGLPDRVIRATGNDALRVQLNNAPTPDLLIGITNGIGGIITVAYLPSTKLDNSDGTRPRLPFPVQTVQSVSVNDGRGTLATTTYCFGGGYYDSAEREFRGFAWASMRDPLEVRTTNYFHQSGGFNGTATGEFEDAGNKAKAGMAYRVTIHGADDKIHREEINKVAQTRVHPNGVYFPFIQQSIVRDYDGVGSSSANRRATAWQFAYDVTTDNLALSTGNLLRTTDFGEVTAETYSHTFTDVAEENAPVYVHNHFAAITGSPDIRNKPDSVKATADLGGTQILSETLYEYHAVTGNVWKEKHRICEGTYATTTTLYEPCGNPETITDPVGLVTGIEYDTATRTYPVRRTRGGFSERSLFDARSGALVCFTNLGGLVTSNEFDVFFRPKGAWISTSPNVLPTLLLSKHEYQLGGIVSDVPQNFMRTLIRDPADTTTGFHETWAYFDGLGRSIQTRVEAETGAFRVVDTFYTALGATKSQTFPYFSSGSAFVNPSGTKNAGYSEFDVMGRLAKAHPCVEVTFTAKGWLSTVTVKAGDVGSPLSFTRWDYRDGANPWAVVVTDPKNKVKKYLLDAFGRTNSIVEVMSAGGNFTSTLRFDKSGNLTHIIDHALNTIQMFYDDMGRKIAMADPDMGYWDYRHDAAGRLREQTDAKGQKTRFYYEDPLGRLSRKEGLNASGQVVSSATCAYDTNGGDSDFTVYPGQLFAVVDSEGWRKHGYDIRGRVLKTSRYLSKNGQVYTQTRAYDDVDRVDTATLPGDAPPVIKYVYNTGMKLQQVKRADIPGGGFTFYTAKGFDAMERLTGILFGNGADSDSFYNYPESRRLSGLRTRLSGGEAVQDLAYTYDEADNVTSITDNVAAHSGAASGAITATSYDDLHRLTSATWAAPFGARSYAYDPIGNVTLNGEAGAATYFYGSFRPHAVKSANAITYAYDQNGNMTVRGGQHLIYDTFNRLCAVKSASALTEFGYDEAGARLWKQGAGPLAVWIGEDYEEKDGRILYHVFASGRRICTFEAGAGCATPDPAKQEYYYHPDHLGSSSVMTDRAGGVVQHYEYSAFGRDRYTESATAKPVTHRYTGQALDDETGLYYYNARYYDPELARFIQPDTVIPDLVGPQSYNRYAYCQNNPLKYTDPTGHDPAFAPGPTSIFVGLNARQMVEASKAAAPAVVGIVVGYGAGYGSAVALAGYASPGFVAVGSGIVGGMAADAAAQGAQIGLGQRSSFSGQEMAVSGLIGGALSYLAHGVSKLFSANEVPKTASAPTGVQANKAAGDAWEAEVISNQLPQTQNNIQSQITIKSSGPSELKVRLDAVGTDNVGGNIRLTDAKASATAPLTPNQTVVYPELQTHGGTVVGAGKPPYSGGTVIPPTKVDIIRKQ